MSGDREFRVLHDGNLIYTAPSENAAFVWLLHHQGQSVQYATTYGGYEIVEMSCTGYGPDVESERADSQG